MKDLKSICGIVILPKKRCWMYWRERYVTQNFLRERDRTGWIYGIYSGSDPADLRTLKVSEKVIVTVEIDRREDPLFIGILTSFLR